MFYTNTRSLVKFSSPMPRFGGVLPRAALEVDLGPAVMSVSHRPILTPMDPTQCEGRAQCH